MSGINRVIRQIEAQFPLVEGYVITLDFPSYMPIMSYCTNRELREELYTAFVTRASDVGPNAGEFDNSQNMKDILALRYELATLLGFDNYAEYSVATKMAESGQEVIDFLNDLAAKAKPQAEREFAELSAYAADELGLTDLNPWDVTFASEKLRQARYSISQEDIRQGPVVPENVVAGGTETFPECFFQFFVVPQDTAGVVELVDIADQAN